jgi:hypothetical protein
MMMLEVRAFDQTMSWFRLQQYSGIKPKGSEEHRLEICLEQDPSW